MTLRGVSAVLILLSTPGATLAADVPPEVRAACMADAKAHCRGVIPGGGRMVACFVKNAGALSEGCKLELSKMSCSADAPKDLKAAFPCG
ncbi:hypothetical protein JJB09_24270 [Rhizobium sp. KVB221]|uniref:Cysteine rich repeat protein n=1 Tax=Rhizobium setariae TaxID=2801340 RepID=A0A936YWW4_9HYPH|nr:cysteine rich repeat-containing protein [Rhizobium setariae]MBL0375135.1 hypothetical protein [Rhizobium setariae]